MSGYLTGWLGESRAARYLKKQGMRVEARRFRGGKLGRITLEAPKEERDAQLENEQLDGGKTPDQTGSADGD